uniref:Secreted protein n=1 Tax=Globodera rostochiensis TaxID=31243 RepID=A0A914I8W7_GLORO
MAFCQFAYPLSASRHLFVLLLPASASQKCLGQRNLCNTRTRADDDRLGATRRVRVGITHTSLGQFRCE